jgi:hypothetical protein
VGRYYFAVSLTQEIPPTWKWTLQRKYKPLAVKLEGDGFRSRQEAIAAAEKALEELMFAMAETRKKEEREKTAATPAALGDHGRH